jgi:platelet-activating factor acetylhydrolase
LDSAAAFLDFGLPPALSWLKQMKVLLLHWTLLKLAMVPDAEILPPTIGMAHTDNTNLSSNTKSVRKYPVVISSHGNGATRAVSSTALAEMVSWGAVVIALEHRDGSCTLTTAATTAARLPYDRTGSLGGKGAPYVHAKRQQLEIRAREVSAVLAAAARGRMPAVNAALDLTKITLHGHSFGGATMLTALARVGQEMAIRECTTNTSSSTSTNIDIAICNCVVHDPAIDWMPDDARDALLGSTPNQKITPPPTSTTSPQHPPMHKQQQQKQKQQHAAAVARFDSTPIMFVYSESWLEWGWGAVRTVQTRVRDGHYGNGSHFCALAGSAHFSFTDMNFLIPGALARALYFAGSTAPAEMLASLRTITQPFLLTGWGLQPNASAPPGLTNSVSAAMDAEDKTVLEHTWFGSMPTVELHELPL